MESVFNTSTEAPIVVRAGKAKITVNGMPMIALSATVTFQRTVEQLPAIGGKKVISIGEPSGTFSAESILAKDANAFKAMGLTGDGCAPFTMTITFNDATCHANGMTVTAHNCIANSGSITVQGSRGVVGHSVTAVFTALTI